MEENLINNNNENIHERILFKEIRKMFYIKYLNLFFAIFRLILMFYLLSLLTYLPTMLNDSLFLIIMLIYSILILPIFTIINLIDIISGMTKRDFKINKNVDNILDCFGYICFGYCCSKNVTTLKYKNLFFGLITLVWSCYIFYYFMKDVTLSNNLAKLSSLEKKVFIKTIFYFLDSIFLFSHSYFFYYYEYILKKGENFIEFYKRLIIKNRTKDAELIRNELPIDVDNFLINSGTEMQNR